MPRTTVTIILRSEYIGLSGETVKNENETFLGTGDSIHEATWDAVERLQRWRHVGMPGTVKTLTHGDNKMCPEVMSGKWTRCHGHAV